MNYSPKLLEKLFNEIAQKANLTLEHSDSITLAEEINAYDNSPTSLKVNGKYLYEAQRKIKLASENEEGNIEFNPSHINQLSKYLGYRDYNEYKESKENPDFERDVKEKHTFNNNKNQHATFIGKNINKIEGDFNNGTINNN